MKQLTRQEEETWRETVIRYARAREQETGEQLVEERALSLFKEYAKHTSDADAAWNALDDLELLED